MDAGAEFNVNDCVICRKQFQDASEKVQVTRGLGNVIKFSQLRSDSFLHAYLVEQSEKQPTGIVLVHRECRKEYVDPKRAKRSSTAAHHSTPKKQKLRSKQDIFGWKKLCLLCKEEVKFDSVHPDRYPDSRRVQGKKESVEMIRSVRKKCDERGDSWSSAVRTRLGLCNDLVAVEAVYHSGCHARRFHGFK